MWAGDRFQVSSVTALLSPATLRVDNGPFPVTAEQQEGSFGLRELGNPLAESGEIQTILWHETPFGEPFFALPSFYPPELEAYKSSSDWKRLHYTLNFRKLLELQAHHHLSCIR
jgi:hypothetical protein